MRHVLLLALLFAAACTRQPSEPEFDNLLDPDGPGGGDPFALRVEFVGPDMQLSWNDISDRFDDLSGYNFYRSTSPNVGAGNFVGSAVVNPEGRVVAYDPSYSRDAINYYKVAATRGNQLSSLAAVEADFAYAPPSARLKNGKSFTPTPLVQLTLLPEVLNRGGDVFELSRSADFSSYDTYTDTGSDTPAAFDVGPAPGIGYRSVIYSRIRHADDTTSPVGIDTLRVDLDIRLDVPQAVGGLRDTTVILTAGDLTGVERMRFAIEEADLAAQNWVVPDSSFMAIPYVLPALDDTMAVYGEFETSFGFLKFERTEDLIPASVGRCTFYLANGDTITSTADIEITRISAPGAGYMRFSEDVSFIGVSWVPVASQHPFTLSPADGPKVVYGQFMNPFKPEPAHWGNFVDGIVKTGS